MGGAERNTSGMANWPGAARPARLAGQIGRGEGSMRMWLAIVAWLAGGTAAGEPLACPDLPVSVTARSGALAERTCRAARRATDYLSACGLALRMPVTVNVVDRAPDTDLPCLGFYHCERGEIELASPRALDRLLLPDGPYSRIPRDLYYDTLVGHEVTHAVIAQATAPVRPDVANSEYVAYAVQLELLGPAGRAPIFAHAGGTEAAPPRPVPLNEVMLGFSPVRFAISAWLHFTGPEGGCAFVSDLVEGRASLSVSGI